MYIEGVEDKVICGIRLGYSKWSADFLKWERGLK